MLKLTKLAVNSRRFDGRIDSPVAVANQGAITQLSEQISTLNERMDEFTSRIEELNSKFNQRVSGSQHNLAEVCNGSGPTSLFVSGLGNGSFPGSKLTTSASSSQLAKENQLLEEIMGMARGQRQVIHQLDSLNNLLHEYLGERSQKARVDRASIITDIESLCVPVLLTLAIGSLGIFLFKSLPSHK